MGHSYSPRWDGDMDKELVLVLLRRYMMIMKVRGILYKQETAYNHGMTILTIWRMFIQRKWYIVVNLCTWCIGNLVQCMLKGDPRTVNPV